MRKLLVAALMVVLATPAFAAIQNVKVSGDITASYVSLNDFDLGYDVGGVPYGLKKMNDFITQTRLRVDADLSDNVSTTVGLVNERAWNAESSATTSTPNGNGTTTITSNNANDTNVQLYLASITLREFLYSPLTLQIGRQVFNYGNGFILGDGGAINQGTGNLQYIDQGLTERTSYDGVTATLDYKPLTISMIYFKNGQTANSIQGLYSPNGQSSDVYGINANYQLNDAMGTVVESYLFTRTNEKSFNLTDKNDTLYVPGLRASTNPTKSLNLQGELAWELGQHPVTIGSTGSTSQEAERRDAMAAQVLATYTVPMLDKYKPTVNASYTYVSGDKNGAANSDDNPEKSAKTYSAWDEFNTIQGAGTIYRSIFPMSNENIISAGASAAPLEDVTTSFTWSGLWAAEKFSSINPLQIYQPNEGTTPQTIATSSKKNAYGLGNEYDVNLSYAYTEDVTFGVSLGWYVPGSALADSNRSVASQAVANIGVKF